MSALRDRALVRAFRDLDVALDWTPSMRAAIARAERVTLTLEGADPDAPDLREALVLGRRALVTPGASCETHTQALALVDGEERPRWIAAERIAAPPPAPGAPRAAADEPATVHADDGRTEAPSAPQQETPCRS